MLLSRTLIKKKSSSNSIENPLHISIHFYSKYLKKNCESFFRWNRPPVVGVLISYFLSTNCDRRWNCSMFIKKKPWNSYSSSSRSGYKWLNISASSLFMLFGCTPQCSVSDAPPSYNIIACKTSMLKFSIAVEFCTCALFKSTKIPLGLARTWLDSTRSVCTPID